MESVAVSVIQATGVVEFESGMRPGQIFDENVGLN